MSVAASSMFAQAIYEAVFANVAKLDVPRNMSDAPSCTFDHAINDAVAAD